MKEEYKVPEIKNENNKVTKYKTIHKNILWLYNHPLIQNSKEDKNIQNVFTQLNIPYESIAPTNATECKNKSMFVAIYTDQNSTFKKDLMEKVQEAKSYNKLTTDTRHYYTVLLVIFTMIFGLLGISSILNRPVYQMHAMIIVAFMGALFLLIALRATWRMNQIYHDKPTSIIIASFIFFLAACIILCTESVLDLNSIHIPKWFSIIPMTLFFIGFCLCTYASWKEAPSLFNVFLILSTVCCIILLMGSIQHSQLLPNLPFNNEKALHIVNGLSAGFSIIVFLGLLLNCFLVIKGGHNLLDVDVKFEEKNYNNQSGSLNLYI